ncbi:MAG: Nif11-like leader peptide family natural product precursor [Anaerolineae bacterium]|nr:Nif11-like leader peptide family natural product precursor [Anaerolineae bacterium]
MNENLQAFLDKMNSDAEFRAHFEGAEMPEARAQLLSDAGLELSAEEAAAAWAGRELSDEELDQAAGGGAGIIRYPPSP